jgi:hypothetical protein
MIIFDKYQLRPVEVFYLMSFNGEETWTIKDALAATLMYLSAAGFIKTEEKEFILTPEGKQILSGDVSASDRLRAYEANVLNAIKDKNVQGIVCSIKFHDFVQDFLDKGMFTKEPVKFLGLTVFKKVVCAPLYGGIFMDFIMTKGLTEIYIRRIQEIKETLAAEVYSFPGLLRDDSIKDRFKFDVKSFEEALVKVLSDAAAEEVAMMFATNRDRCGMQLIQPNGFGI